jgi:hypothetical protein
MTNERVSAQLRQHLLGTADERVAVRPATLD